MPSIRARFAFAAGVFAAIGVVLWARRRAEARAIATRGPMTQATVPQEPSDMPMGEPGHNEEERLDEALQESFPSSDPVSIRIE